MDETRGWKKALLEKGKQYFGNRKDTDAVVKKDLKHKAKKGDMKLYRREESTHPMGEKTDGGTRTLDYSLRY
jgi:hypothetical protein